MKKPWYMFLIPQEAINYIRFQSAKEVGIHIHSFSYWLKDKPVSELLSKIGHDLINYYHLGDFFQLREKYEKDKENEQ